MFVCVNAAEARVLREADAALAVGARFDVVLSSSCRRYRRASVSGLICQP